MVGGQTYYQVPGQADLVFDPYHGANGGVQRISSLQQQAKATELQNKQLEAAANPPSAAEQIGLGVAGAAALGAGTYAGKEIAQNGVSGLFGSGSAAKTGAETGYLGVGGATQQGTQVAAPEIISATNTGSTQGSLALGQAAGSSSAPYAVGTAANGGTLMSDGSVLAAGSEAGTASTLGTAAGYIGPALGVAGTLYGAYQVGQLYGKNKPGYSAAAGAGAGASAGGLIGSVVPGVGTLAGAGIGALAGAAIGGALGTAKSGRHEDHQTRSMIRDALTAGNFLERTTDLGGTIDPVEVPNSSGTYVRLANGSLYDVSGERKNAGYNVKAVDNPWSGQAIGWANPISYLSEAMVDPEGKMRGYMTGYYTNAIMSNAGEDPEIMRQNALAMWNKLGVDQATAEGMINDMVAKKRITQQEGDAFKYGISTMLSGDQKGYVPGSVTQMEQQRDGHAEVSGEAEPDADEDDKETFKPEISGPSKVPGIQNVNTRGMALIPKR